ncbi:MAG: hypothetical protein RR444_04645 [Oscillospiraceae bacterium]
MERRVLIIKGFSKNELELKNDCAIIKLYSDYFSSKAGGCYDTSNEIIILEEPTTEEIKKLESEFANLEFLIVVLLGHGANKDGKQIFWLAEDTYIYPGQIIFETKKQLFIIESCRDLIDFEIEVSDISSMIPKFRYGGVINRPKTVAEAKKAYNDALTKCKEDITYLFASSIDESAKGYYFIHTLIKASVFYHEQTQRKIYTTKQVFEQVQKAVQQLTNSEQNPIMEGKGEFPFVLSII